MPRLLLVDGHNLLFQMFFGMPARIISRDGKCIHGVMGFVGALKCMTELCKATHALAVFDGEHENPRALIDPAYKANRTGDNLVPDIKNPFSQLPSIYRALDYMRLRHVEASGCEADDLIAGCTEAFSSAAEITIASYDSDFFQLIGERVSVLRYRGKDTVLCGKEYITERYGIPPASFADFKSLVGDASDNIRGIPGIGPKTAAKLLERFANLEGIINGVDEIYHPATRSAILGGIERLKANYSLVKLGGIAPPFNFDELSYAPSGETTIDVLRAIDLI